MNQKVVISGSGSLQSEVNLWKGHFEGKGYEVIAFPKPWNNSESHDIALENLYIDFYKAIDDCDIFFLMNEDKNGIEGYIGANCTAELIYAVVQKLKSKKEIRIQIAKIPNDQVPISEEIKSFLRLGWIELYADDRSKLIH